MCSKYTVLNVTSKYCSNDCFGFELKVDKFSSVKNVTSSQLVTSQACKTAWRVIVETAPRIRRSNTDYRTVLSEGKMRVGLKRTDSNKCEVKASFFFEVLNSSELIYYKESFERVFSQAHPEFYCDYVKRPGRIARLAGVREVWFSLPDDKLTIRGNVIIEDCCPKTKTEKDLNATMNVTELLYDFRELYKNNLFSDVVFVFGSEKIYSHKNVLSTRSPVFKKMFEHDMLESKLNTVKITDIEKRIFDYFLLYLYTGIMENNELDTVLSLYSTADKYQVTTLFQTCSNTLQSYISDKTVSSILLYADLHSDELLKEKAVQFICEKFELVEGSPGWYSLIDKNPSLGSYVLTAVSLSIISERKKVF